MKADDDALGGFRRDTIILLRELSPSILRWPGGNFVSGYDWRDGVGDRDRRPPRKNPTWAGVVSNDMGVHEFLQLCRLLAAEPLIVVNAGLGSPESAAALVAYVTRPLGLTWSNGTEESLLEEPRRRAKNGQRLPWKVKWWGVGNEQSV